MSETPATPESVPARATPPLWARPWVPLLLLLLLAATTAWAIAATVRGGADTEDPGATMDQACEHVQVIADLSPIAEHTSGDPSGLEIANRLGAAYFLAETASAQDPALRDVTDTIREPYALLAQRMETGERYETAIEAATTACADR